MAGQLKRYTVEVSHDGRRKHTTTLMLSDADAKKRGLVTDDEKPAKASKARTPANKSRSAQNK